MAMPPSINAVRPMSFGAPVTGLPLVMTPSDRRLRRGCSSQSGAISWRRAAFDDGTVPVEAEPRQRRARIVAALHHINLIAAGLARDVRKPCRKRLVHTPGFSRLHCDQGPGPKYSSTFRRRSDPPGRQPTDHQARRNGGEYAAVPGAADEADIRSPVRKGQAWARQAGYGVSAGGIGRIQRGNDEHWQRKQARGVRALTSINRVGSIVRSGSKRLRSGVSNPW